MSDILIYACHPYSGDEEDNFKRSFGQQAHLEAIGFLVDNPLLSHKCDKYCKHEWGYWMRVALKKLSRCDVVFCQFKPKVSRGCDLEMAWASECGLPLLVTYAEARLYWDQHKNDQPPCQYMDEAGIGF